MNSYISLVCLCDLGTASGEENLVVFSDHAGLIVAWVSLQM